ncbi:MAG: hypothetical protein A3F72_02290 [Bacteroidetes bacterium RIFCSPLOWO2_12_FULL_35_15]|nr:MAG: hypothetical protein A3F72_02290 [Bacteroidetes bacterium RIFCSPLOWO2_12_FULL_35_15]
MNLYLHFILVNSEFNQGLADDLNEGQESEDNIKHLWEDELLVSEPVKEFKIKNNAIYTLAGYFPDDKPFSFEIWDTTIVDCLTESGNQMQFAVSKKLLKKTEKIVDEKTNDTHLYFYLRDAIPMENPMNGVYIVKSDFPKELKKND